MAKRLQTNQDRLLQFMQQVQQQTAQSQASAAFYLPQPTPMSPNAALVPSAPMTRLQMPATIPGFSLGSLPPMFGQILGGPMAQAATMLFGGAINNFVSDNGRFLPGPMFGRTSLFDEMRNQAVMQSMQQAMNMSQAPDIMMASKFLGNTAIAMRGTTDPGEIASLRATAGKAAENMMGVMSPFVSMIAASPQIRQMADSVGLTRMLGTQIAAAKISMAERGPFTPFGADPTAVAGVATGIADYFAPGGVENLLRSRGFNTAELGDLYAGLATRGLLPTPPGMAPKRGAALGKLQGQTGFDEEATLGQGGRLVAGVSQGKSQDINRKLESYARAVELVSQVMGPNAPMEKLLQGLEKITGGGLSQLDPSKLEHRVMAFQETANFANIDTDLLMNLTQQSAIFASQVGVNTVIAAPSAALAVRMEAADRQIRRSDGGAGPEFGRETEGERIAGLTKAAIGGAASTVGKTAAGIQAVARSLGGRDKLPPHLKQVLDDFYSTDHAKQSRAAEALSSPGLITQELAKATGVSYHTMSTAMQNQNFYGPEQDEKSAAAIMRIQAIQDVEQLAIAHADDVTNMAAAGLRLNKGETNESFMKTLGYAFYDASSRKTGEIEIRKILEARGMDPSKIGAHVKILSGALGGEVRNESQTREKLGPGAIAAEKQFQKLMTIREAFTDTIYGKTSTGGLKGYVNNLMRYVTEADPTKLDAADLLRVGLGGVPANIAISSSVRSLAGKYGVSLTDENGEDRDPANIVAELGSRIITAANKADPATRKEMLKEYNILLGAGESTGFGVALDLAEASAIATISEDDSLTEDQKKDKIKEQTETFQKLRKAQGLDTAQVAGDLYRTSTAKHLGRVEAGAKKILKASDKFSDATINAGASLSEAAGKLFSDLEKGELNADLEATLSEDKKKKLKAMAPKFREAMRKTKKLKELGKDQEIDDESRQDLKERLELLGKARDLLLTDEEKEEEDKKPKRKEIEKPEDGKKARKKAEDASKGSSSKNNSEHEEPMSDGTPAGTKTDPLFVVRVSEAVEAGEGGGMGGSIGGGF